jgi:actin cytoskeleton-regulatory complex protein PAN1
MQTGMPFQQQQQQLIGQPTGYPSLQAPQQRQAFTSLQPQPTGFPGAQFQQTQATGFNQFQRPMITGAPLGFQNQPGGIPPVPPLPSNLSIPSQPTMFRNTSPSPSGFSPAGAGLTSGFQPAAAPLVAQPTGFMDPRLTMMGSTFMPTAAGGGFSMGSAPQYNGATLQQSIAQLNQDKRGSAQHRIPWTLSKQERKQYDQIFRAWDTAGSGFLEGQKALEVFGASGLEKNDLIKIW